MRPGPFSLIVIGTSAGGVEALSAVLPALPPTLGAAVLVVIHLPRERPSLLVDIFGPKCRLPVREAQDKEPLLAGTIFPETIFDIDGIGLWALLAVGQRDLPIVQATALFAATALILSNLVVDLLYSVLDPRVRLS